MKRIVCALLLLAMPQPVLAEPVTVDAARSSVTVHVFKQGLFAAFADDHDIVAPIASGTYDAARRSIELRFEAARLTVMDPKLPASRRGEVQSTMTGTRVLDVQAYPAIAFASTTIDETDPARWTVTGDLTLHGRTHRVTFAVSRTDANHFTGTTTIRQSAFGIRPIRLAGGTVAVKDDVRIDFAIVL